MTWTRRKPEQRPSHQNSRPELSPSTERAPRGEAKRETLATIGPTIRIRGKVSGNQDLTIEGKVRGTITLKGHTLTLGAGAGITAKVRAARVVVGGEVTGEITADEQVDITSTGIVQGDVRTPRITISDGAHLKGNVDTERGQVTTEKEATSSRRTQRRASA
jgi:cytoskeletal protein CcmA (bactofilin family)